MRIATLLLVATMLQAQAYAQQPRLVILIAVDQLRSDRLTTELPGGLGDLARNGRMFSNAMLDHAATSTCPGHAVMLTGVNPSRNGIGGNEYFDRQSWQTRYCVEDPEHRVIGGTEGRSPKRLQATTLGDWMKAADPTARVFTLAAKDRAAITLGGQYSDASFWLDRETGQFTSSSYYLESLPGWLKSFNGGNSNQPAWLQGLPGEWTHPALGPRPDSFEFESDEFERISPHPLNSGDLEDRVNQIYASPYMDQVVTSLAIELISQEGLGEDDTTDLLALSYAATDTVGHLYGPHSSESMDALRRLGVEIERLLQALDDHVGLDNVLIVLTSDHGVLPIPEDASSATASAPACLAERTNAIELIFSLWWEVYWSYTAPFTGPWNLVNFAESQLYINHSLARELGTTPEQIIADLEGLLEAQPAIHAAWTADELRQSTHEHARLIRNSLAPPNVGDLYLQTAEGCLVGGDTGTSHGSLYEYDRHVPLVFFGAGISPGVTSEPAATIDIAPTLAPMINVPRPAGLQGKRLVLSPLESQ